MVVFGFYVRSHLRLFADFHFYAKPYFVLDDGELSLRNSPVISPEDLYAQYASGRRRISDGWHSYLLGHLGKLAAKQLERRDPRAEDSSWQLMAAILRRARDTAARNGSQLFLLIFPTRPGRYEGWAWETIDALAQAEARRLGIPHLSLGGGFAAARAGSPEARLFQPREAGGHLSVRGNEVVAKLLAEALRESGLAPGSQREDGARVVQAAAQVRHREVGGVDAAADGEGGGGARSLSGGHAGGDLLGRVVHPMVDRDATTGREHVAQLPRQQAAIRDVVDGAVLRPVAGHGDGVVEGAVHGLAGQHEPTP